MLKIKNEKVKPKKTSGKQLFIVLSILFFNCVFLQAQTISPFLFGQNAWMPASIGTANPGGTLDYHWQDVKDSHCTSVRIGGIGYDHKTANGGPATTDQLVELINNIYNNGGEPIVQIDYADGSFTPTDAQNVVTAINITMVGEGTIQRKVKYWSIGNEPDGHYAVNFTAPLIHDYIIAFSAAMKLIDPEIKIIAPSLSEYNKTLNPGILTALIGGTSDITMQVPFKSYYYIDYVDFHYYPFSSTNGSKALVISTITDAGGFNTQLTGLNTKISNANSMHTRISPNLLQMAVTEGNINWQNPSDNTLGGISANSFIAGQFWAEMLATCMQNSVQFMNFWSVIEGSTWLTDLGYLSPSSIKRSTWWHFELLANNFKGTYTKGSVTPTTIKKLKAYGSYNLEQIAVMITNQDSIGYNYSLNLGTIGNGSYSTKVNFAAGLGLSVWYDCYIPANTTTLFVFDHNGNISQQTNYGLSDLTNPPANTCSTSFSCINQSQFETNYTPGVHSTITIGGTGSGQSAISLNATHNAVFKSVGTITITGAGGAFSSNNQALELINTNCE